MKRFASSLFVWFAAVALISTVGLVYVASVRNRPSGEPEAGPATGRKRLTVRHFDRTKFDLALRQAEGQPATATVRALIVPHHLLAADLIAKGMKSASGRRIDRVIIIGPNHQNLGGSKILLADSDWLTPAGKSVQADRELARNLLSALPEAGVLPAVFEDEQSISALVPFVAEYYPSAKILPIILSSKSDPGTDRELGAWLSKETGQEALVIASIDFAHYLPTEQARANLNEISALITSGEEDQFADLGNDYLDSPPSLIATQRFARLNGLSPQIMTSGVSADYLGYSDQTTGYLVVSYGNTIKIP